MNEYAKAILELSKACSVRRFEASSVVTAKPCYVFFISACPTDGAALYEGALHNGESSSDENLLDIESQYAQDYYEFYPPLYFNRGLYLALTTNMKSITVQYLEA